MTHEIVFLMFALIAGHVVSVGLIMHGMRRVVSELKAVVLEREETNRMFYTEGPDIGRDTAFYSVDGGDSANTT
jgi:hypothetical protein